MISDTTLTILKTDFPQEALSLDNSRGFALTSIKAAYVIERLNEAFGLCGWGWRYACSNPQWHTDNELVVQVAIQYRVDSAPHGAFAPVDWNTTSQRWEPDNLSPAVWSMPTYAFGGKRSSGKGSAPVTDAHKSAVTDALTKAASMFGIGHEVFKGHVTPELESGARQTSSRRQRPPAAATASNRPWSPKEAALEIRAEAIKRSKGKGKDAASPKFQGFLRGMFGKALLAMDESMDEELVSQRAHALVRAIYQKDIKELTSAQAQALTWWLLIPDTEEISSTVPEEIEAMLVILEAEGDE